MSSKRSRRIREQTSGPHGSPRSSSPRNEYSFYTLDGNAFRRERYRLRAGGEERRQDLLTEAGLELVLTTGAHFTYWLPNNCFATSGDRRLLLLKPKARGDEGQLEIMV